MRYAIVTVLTAMGTMHCIDDTVTGKHSISTHRDHYEAELRAMALNCSAEEGDHNDFNQFIDAGWV